MPKRILIESSFGMHDQLELPLHASTHWPHSSSVLGSPYRIPDMNPKKELLWGLWVGLTCTRATCVGIGFRVCSELGVQALKSKTLNLATSCIKAPSIHLRQQSTQSKSAVNGTVSVGADMGSFVVDAVGVDVVMGGGLD